MTVWLSDMEAAERFAAKVSMLKCVDVGDMNVGSRYKGVEFVGGVGERAKGLCEIQDGGVMWS